MSQNIAYRDLLKANSFGFMRLVLASTVVFQHALALTAHESETRFGFLRGADLGTVGVAGFFAVSGFLLMGSANRLGSKDFFRHRLFRLLPGLWFALIVVSFVLVPFAAYVSINSVSFYFFQGDGSSFDFALSNSLLFVLQDSIGTVFSENPYPLAVNGALWTLAPEFICYMGLLLIAVSTKRRTRFQLPLLSFALAVGSLLWTIAEVSTTWAVKDIVSPALILGIAFTTGAIIAQLLERYPRRPPMIPTFVALVIWISVGAGGPISVILLSVLVVSLGLAITNQSLTKIGRNTDLSYGIYLFHFPVIQTVISATAISWSLMLSIALLPAIAIAVSSALAFVSWKTIEKPAIHYSRSNSKFRIKR
jgi:peptidoglycan/LPS O-acetylase OafA/YrhL